MTTVVVCIWGPGIRGAPEMVPTYVRRLYRGLCRYSTLPFKFVIFADDRNKRDYGPGIEVRDLPLIDDGATCLPKLYAHSDEAGLTGRVLLMDIDTIIGGDMDPILAWRGAFISRADEVSLRRGQPVSGGNMQSFEAGTTRHLWLAYRDEHSRCMTEWRGWERLMIRRLVQHQTFWQREIPDSMKHVRRQLNANRNQAEPDGSAVLIATGAVRPHAMPGNGVRMLWESHDRTLRLRLYPPARRNLNQLQPLRDPEFIRQLKAAGVILTDREHDATLLQSQMCERSGGCNPGAIPDDVKGPVIVIEKVDGCQVAPGHDHLYQHERVIGWLKGYRHKNGGGMAINGRYHFTAITGDAGEMQTDLQGKTALLWGFVRDGSCELFAQREPDWTADRHTDALYTCGQRFSGDGACVQQHRDKAAKAVSALTGRRTAVHTRRLPFARYIDATYASKVVVSPWGEGEACIRDYEAMLAGCVVIKPPCEWVEDMAGVFDHVVTCRPDFSDLPERVAEALDRYKDTDARKRARAACLTQWDNAELARQVAGRMWKFARGAGIFGVVHAGGDVIAGGPQTQARQQQPCARLDLKARRKRQTRDAKYVPARRVWDGNKLVRIDKGGGGG